MLPSLAFQEILLIGILALVIIGPKDLPLMLRKLGRWTARLRGMAQEFRTGFDELARQAELDELKKEVEALRRSTNLNSLANEISKPLPTLEDYAGIAKLPPRPAAKHGGIAGDPVAGEVAALATEERRAEGTASGAEAVPAERPSPPTPSPQGGGGALFEDAALDQPLARSAP